MSAAPKLVTLHEFAEQNGQHVGFLLYLRGQPGFPKPALRHGRDDYYAPAAIEHFLQETRRSQKHWSARGC